MGPLFHSGLEFNLSSVLPKTKDFKNDKTSSNSNLNAYTNTMFIPAIGIYLL